MYTSVYTVATQQNAITNHDNALLLWIPEYFDGPGTRALLTKCRMLGTPNTMKKFGIPHIAPITPSSCVKIAMPAGIAHTNTRKKRVVYRDG